MPIDLDGLTVLRALVQHPDPFPTARSRANELAHTLVSGRLAKKPTLEVLRRVKGLLADSDFRLIMDEISDKGCKSLLKAVDPHSPLLKDDGADIRGRIVLLSVGAAEAAPKPEKPKKTVQAKTSGKPRKNRDDDPDT